MPTSTLHPSPPTVPTVPHTVPAAGPPSSAASPAPSYVGNTHHLTAQPSGYLLRGLPLPSASDPGTVGAAAYISAAYAVETRMILEAEAVIAERRYRQQLMVAQSLRLHMLHAKQGCQAAFNDVAHLRHITSEMIAGASRTELVEALRISDLYDYI